MLPTVRDTLAQVSPADDVRPPGERRARAPRLPAAARRTQLLAAAREVFLRSGLGGARVREIALVAGVNEGLLYKYFASKEELFEEAIAEPLELMVTELLGHANNVDELMSSPERREAEVVALIGTLLAVVPALAPLLGALLFADPERGQRFYRQRLLPAIENLSRAVDAAAPDWEHREFDARLLVTSVIATCFAVSLDDRFDVVSADGRGRVAQELTANILRGIELPAAR